MTEQKETKEMVSLQSYWAPGSMFQGHSVSGILVMWAKKLLTV